jgi:hypothetical protein
MSKSARIIKSIYKKKVCQRKRMTTKKTINQLQLMERNGNYPNQKQNVGENKPGPQVVLKGGTTLTGQTRGILLRLDAMMRKRYGQDPWQKQVRWMRR